MNNLLKSAVRKQFPCALIIKAWLVALCDSCLPIRDSYAQAGDDKIIVRLLKDMRVNSKVYVDVGANHPSRLSNTYRLYREGFSGLVIEPNRGLLRLHRIFRPRDIHLNIGCGAEAAVLSFKHASADVLSGFESEGLKATEFLGSELVPVLPLDLVLKEIDFAEISVLTVDVEGFDLQVVQGATATLRKTRIVAIEGNENDEKLVGIFRNAGFRLAVQNDHNLFFVNSAVATTD